ncbi:MAG: ASCH domain-containing protein [Mycetocola sp.]
MEQDNAAADAELAAAEFAFPGPLRDQLVAAILDGAKTSTTSLRQEYTVAHEPIPVAGTRQRVIDSTGATVAIIELTDVRTVALGDVPLSHAVDEGEGHTTVAAWRAAHERFWHSDDLRAELGDAGFRVDDSTPVVLERFSVVRRVMS